MIKQTPMDSQQRQRALDPGASFIVQAPAGSGKTELLSQRYLRLLSLVDSPEEILAITFTRKAAAEMRERIVRALMSASSGTRPTEAHSARTWDLAFRALEQDRALNWNILDNPARLKIRTIDSFCLYLTAGMPLFSGLGRDLEVMEDPEALYREAARNTLLELKKDSPWFESLSTILLHLDNDWTKAAGLIKDMLKLREHWLRLVGAASGHGDLRNLLEGHLRREIERRLQKTTRLFNQLIGPEDQRLLLECASYALKNLKEEKRGFPLASLEELKDFPGCALHDLEYWLGIRALLQTASGSWRVKVDRSTGFPPGSSFPDQDSRDRADFMKSRFQDLLKILSRYPELEKSLAGLGDLPDSGYIDHTWQVLGALIQVLKMSVAQLSLVMQSLGRLDYPEISMGALQALGEPQNPSELMLRLDYQIRHILFDEFQDTSITQQEILTKLVSGWTPGDGRTLFLVGDPMQSIYSFRDADVGVFLKARQDGIGEVLLEPLSLRVNFRSGHELVDWINRVFPGAFQDEEDHVSGSIRYSSMHAARDFPGSVHIHPLLDPGPEDEALEVARIISETKQNHPGENLAVLVRSRTHLAEIIKILRQNRHSFQGVDIEPLKDRQVVLDLYSLTKVLLRPWDNLSWLCILRTPWAGLDLRDLSRLTSPGEHKPILEKLKNTDRVEGLSREGRFILEKMARVLVPAWENRRRRPLSRLVEAVWTDLGGPACLRSPQELEDAATFLEHLAAHEHCQSIEDIPEFEKSLDNLFSRPDPKGDELLQIMTIHKAKGLEFDHVILLGLEKVPRGSDRLLLQFMEVPAGQGEDSFSRLLLAPIASVGQKTSPTYSFIEGLKKTRLDNEAVRLLYVAATRARKSLHLLASASLKNRNGSGTVPAGPRKNSFLSYLWHDLKPLFEKARASRPLDRETSPAESPCNLLFRLDPSWNPPEIKARSFPGRDQAPVHQVPDDPVPYQWAGDTIRNIGISVHELLARIAENGIEKWNESCVENCRRQVKSELLRLGVSAHDLEQAAAKVITAVKNTLSHSVGRWILSRHKEARCEYPLSAVLDGEVIRVVVDRTFIDHKDIRWIIDYKTSVHEGGGLDHFLDNEMLRYQDQLIKYRRIFQMMDDRNVRAGLYFPLLKAWRELGGQ